MNTISSRRFCTLCSTLLKPNRTVFKSFSTNSKLNQSTNEPSTSTTSTSTSSTSSSPSNRVKSIHEIRLENLQKQLQTQLSTLITTARTKSGTTIKSWELERKFGEMGGKINRATGYEEIERLRLGVSQKEKTLAEVREQAISAKKTYSQAMALRNSSQKEVNDLLQRKSNWSSGDVVRFTELVQQDHENERAEATAKQLMELAEEGVEKGFSDLMQAILERYHEEQVWSDKIRSLSTYGSLAITSLNVLLFIIAILLVEPWKRKRLVEGVEGRLRINTIQSHEATLSSLSALESLLTSSSTKLDQLLPTSPILSSLQQQSTLLDSIELEEPSQTQGVDDLLIYPSSSLEDDSELIEENEVVVEENKKNLYDRFDLSQLSKLERNQELMVVGGFGAVIGIGISLVAGLVSR